MISIAFEKAFSLTVGSEGAELDLDPADHGNWTGAWCGKGVLGGSRFGISSGSYPTIDMRTLTLDAAKAIYQRDYWKAARCDLMAEPLCIVVFDSAVNNGVGGAARLLQQALGVTADGSLGPRSLAALASADYTAIAREFVARRIVLQASVPIWQRDALGFSRRLVAQALATA